jgi:hypothetical protein
MDFYARFRKTKTEQTPVNARSHRAQKSYLDNWVCNANSGVSLERKLAAVASLETICVGALSAPNKLPPKNMPLTNTPAITKAITPGLGGEGLSHRNCFFKSCWSRRFIEKPVDHA